MNATRPRILPSLCGALVLTSCLANPSQHPAESASTSTGKVYARDGSVVAAESAGTVHVDNAPTRDVGVHEGSRVYLLELYQKTVEEKDALGLEVQALRAELERDKRAGNEGAKSLDDFASKLAAVVKDRDALTAENLDLAARLTTAQILRLEAEKSLLELQIDQHSRESASRASAKPKPEKP
jgi:hypothetical protein